MYKNMGLEEELGEKLMDELKGISFLYKSDSIPLEEFHRLYKNFYYEAIEKARNKKLVEQELISEYEIILNSRKIER